MFDYNIYYKIETAKEKHIEEKDIVYSLIEELGEITRAIQAEDNEFSTKSITEGSTVEIIDLCLVAIHLFIRRGGTFQEACNIAEIKLNKWLSKLELYNDRK